MTVPATSIESRSLAPRSQERPWRRGVLGAAVFAGGLYVYTFIQDLATPKGTFATGLDVLIPFVPELVLVYALFFPFVVVAAFTADRCQFDRILIAGGIAAVTGWVCFLLFPAALDRPDPATIESAPLRTLFELLYWVDDSHNTFPSLHVAITWIVCLAFRGTRYFWLASLTAALICMSTLFVKQHTLIDVGGGTLLAALSLAAASALTGRMESS